MPRSFKGLLEKEIPSIEVSLWYFHFPANRPLHLSLLSLVPEASEKREKVSRICLIDASVVTMQVVSSVVTTQVVSSAN